MDEHTALVSVGLGGVVGVVALALCGHGDMAIGLLAFISGIALYIVGRSSTEA